jgi:hypothetical protein
MMRWNCLGILITFIIIGRRETVVSSSNSFYDGVSMTFQQKIVIQENGQVGYQQRMTPCDAKFLSNNMLHLSEHTSLPRVIKCRTTENR